MIKGTSVHHNNIAAVEEKKKQSIVETFAGVE